VLATYLFLLFLSGILHYSYAKGYDRFLEQPLWQDWGIREEIRILAVFPFAGHYV